MRCSLDLRQRVVDFVRGGGSKAEAARRFRVGEASVFRWLEHCGPDDDSHLGYRSAQQIAHGRSQCPLARLQAQLAAAGVLDSATSTALEDTIAQEIDAAFNYAISSPHPGVVDLERHLFA